MTPRSGRTRRAPARSFDRPPKLCRSEVAAVFRDYPEEDDLPSQQETEASMNRYDVVVIPGWDRAS
jgi:hypothetical protein